MRPTSSKSFLIALTTGLILSLGYAFYPKSISVKEQILRGPASSSIKMHQKAAGLFEVEINSLLPAATKAGDAIELEATITARHDVASSEYAWLLPSQIQANTEIKGILGPMKTGDVKTVSFRAVALSEENQHIHLKVFQNVDRERMGSTTQYNTRDEQVITEKLRTKAEILESQANARGERLKVTQ